MNHKRHEASFNQGDRTGVQSHGGPGDQQGRIGQLLKELGAESGPITDGRNYGLRREVGDRAILAAWAQEDFDKGTSSERKRDARAAEYAAAQAKLAEREAELAELQNPAIDQVAEHVAKTIPVQSRGEHEQIPVMVHIGLPAEQ